MELLWVFISSLSFFLHCSLPSMSVFCGCQYSFIAFTIAWTPLDTLVTVTILWKIRWSTNLTMSVGWGGLLNDMHGGYSNAKNLFFWQHWLITDAAVIRVRTWESGDVSDSFLHWNPPLIAGMNFHGICLIIPIADWFTDIISVEVTTIGIGIRMAARKINGKKKKKGLIRNQNRECPNWSSMELRSSVGYGF